MPFTVTASPMDSDVMACLCKVALPACFAYSSRMKCLTLALAATLLAALVCIAQDDVDGFVARMYRNSNGETLQYRLFIPARYEKNRSYPIVLWLHGADGA